MKKENKPIFVGVKSKDTGIMYSPDKIPKEFVEKYVRDPIIIVYSNQELKVG